LAEDLGATFGTLESPWLAAEEEGAEEEVEEEEVEEEEGAAPATGFLGGLLMLPCFWLGKVDDWKREALTLEGQ
jgi:hypothetical protein